MYAPPLPHSKCLGRSTSSAPLLVSSHGKAVPFCICPCHRQLLLKRGHFSFSSEFRVQSSEFRHSLESSGGEMGRKLGLDKVLDCFSLSLCTNACVCIHSVEDEDEEGEGKALVSAQLDELLKLKDFGGGAKTLAFHLEPKTVELKVSMHCYGCARKVQKHISKMEGVTSFEVDLENKKVVVTGDITPYEVLQSVSKVMKFAELLAAPRAAETPGR